MAGKNKCKWCGAEVNDTIGEITFASCGTWVAKSKNIDVRSAQCERDELRQRVDAAVKVLNRISEFGDWLQWDDVVDVLEILRGNIPTNLEGS